MGSWMSRLASNANDRVRSRFSSRYSSDSPCVVTFGNRYIEKLCFLKREDANNNFNEPFYAMIKEHGVHMSYLYLSECLFPIQQDYIEGLLAWCVLRCYDMVLLPRFRHPLLLDHVLAMQAMQQPEKHIPFHCVIFPTDLHAEALAWRRMDETHKYLYDVVVHQCERVTRLEEWLTQLQCIWLVYDSHLYCVFVHDSVSISKLIQNTSHNDMINVLIHPRYRLDKQIIETVKEYESYYCNKWGWYLMMLRFLKVPTENIDPVATPVSYESPEYPENDIIPLYYHDSRAASPEN